MRLDVPVFLFAAAVMMVAGLVVGLAPLLTTGAGRVVAVMNEGGRAALQGRTTRRVLAGMVVVEVALAIALVAGAGRLLLSMRNLVTINPGFTAAGRLAIDVSLPVRPYLREPARLSAWYRARRKIAFVRSAPPAWVSLPRCRCGASRTRPPSWTSRDGPTESSEPAERAAARRRSRFLRGDEHPNRRRPAVYD